MLRNLEDALPIHVRRYLRLSPSERIVHSQYQQALASYYKRWPEPGEAYAYYLEHGTDPDSPQLPPAIRLTLTGSAHPPFIGKGEDAAACFTEFRERRI